MLWSQTQLDAWNIRALGRRLCNQATLKENLLLTYPLLGKLTSFHPWEMMDLEVYFLITANCLFFEANISQFSGNKRSITNWYATSGVFSSTEVWRKTRAFTLLRFKMFHFLGGLPFGDNNLWLNMFNLLGIEIFGLLRCLVVKDLDLWFFDHNLSVSTESWHDTCTFCFGLG